MPWLTEFHFTDLDTKNKELSIRYHQNLISLENEEGTCKTAGSLFFYPLVPW
jgi:hypothetical protein